MSRNNLSIRQTDRTRGVSLSHPGCAPLLAAHVRSAGLDWRIRGSEWGEGHSPTLLFFWVISGSVRFADGSLTAGPDHCLLIPPTIAKRLCAPTGTLHAAYVHVLPESPWNQLIGAPQMLPAARARHVGSIIAALADETIDHQDIALARPLAEAVLACCTTLTASPAASVHTERRQLQQLWDEVAAMPGRQWTVAGLANRLHLSEGHFHRRVRAVHGRSPMAMVRHLRLERAADRLRTTTASLTDIASEVGYANPFALSNALRQFLGLRPEQLRLRNE